MIHLNKLTHFAATRTLVAVIMAGLALGSFMMLHADGCSGGMWGACDQACGKSAYACDCSATPTGYGYSIDCGCCV